MNRCTTLRRYVVRIERSVVASVFALTIGCTPHRIPESLRGYDVIVEGRDEQSRELARAMKEYGFHVRDRIRGASRPTAALIHFTFSDPGAGQPVWFNLRLADTRSGVIVGVGTVQLDSTLSTPRARATAAVQTISAP